MRGAVLSSALLVTACGEPDDAGDRGVDAGRDAAAPDAPAADADPDAPPPDAVGPDAPPGAPVVTVACPATPAVTLIAGNGSYTFTPADGFRDDQHTIGVGDVVRVETAPTHDVVSGPFPDGDGVFFVDFDSVACLRFDQVGSYTFFCSLHAFDGVLHVQ